MKIDHLADVVERTSKTYEDHEVRIRALELAHARLGGGTALGSSLWQAIWPAAAVIISLLAYLKT